LPELSSDEWDLPELSSDEWDLPELSSDAERDPLSEREPECEPDDSEPDSEASSAFWVSERMD